jgi:hypothetical protein
MLLYHVSPRANRDSIIRLGVDPIFATGEHKYSWWVDRPRLEWAIIHVSAKYNLSVLQCDVFMADNRSIPRLRRADKIGLFYTPCRAKVEAHDAAIIVWAGADK